MRYALIVLLMLAGAATALASPAVAVRDAWIRWLPAGAPMAGYFTLDNSGPGAVALSGARSPAFGSVSMHEIVRADDGSTAMRPVKPPLTVSAGESVAFEPGGYHLMLMQPQRALRSGDEVEITFRAESGVSFTAAFEVRSAIGK